MLCFFQDFLFVNICWTWFNSTAWFGYFWMKGNSIFNINLFCKKVNSVILLLCVFVKFIKHFLFFRWIMRRVLDGIHFDNMKSSILSRLFWFFPFLALWIMHVINLLILTLLHLLNFGFFFKIVIVKPLSRIFELFTIFKLKVSYLVRLKRTFLDFFFLFDFLTLWNFLVKLLVIFIKLLKSIRWLYWRPSLRSLNLFNLRYKSALIQLLSFIINFRLF